MNKTIKSYASIGLWFVLGIALAMLVTL